MRWNVQFYVCECLFGLWTWTWTWDLVWDLDLCEMYRIYETNKGIVARGKGWRDGGMEG